jgi:hypothetical protein
MVYRSARRAPRVASVASCRFAELGMRLRFARSGQSIFIFIDVTAGSHEVGDDREECLARDGHRT